MEKGKEVPKTANPSALKKLTPLPTAKPLAAGKATEIARPDSALGGAVPRRGNKLRDRTAGKDKPQAIGDEPVEGPDMYYYLKDLDSPAIIQCLVEELNVPVGGIFRVEDVPGHYKKTTTQDENQDCSLYWDNLTILAQPGFESTPWGSVAFSTFLSTEYQGTKEIFELVSKRIFSIINKKKMYEDFYSGDIPLSVPSFNKAKSELRYYEYLSAIAFRKGIATPEIVMSFVMEQLCRNTSEEEDEEPQDQADIQFSYEDLGQLNVLFNNAAQKLLFAWPASNAVASSKSDYIVHFRDKNLISLQQLEDLDAIGLNTVDMIAQIVAHSSEKKIVNFTTEMNEYKNIDKELFLNDKLKLNHEFQRVQEWNADKDVHQHALLKMRFEGLFNDINSKHILNAYCWREKMPSSALMQAIQTAKLSKSVLSNVYSKFDGMLLLSVSNPGPIGCLSYQLKEQIKVLSFNTRYATKLGSRYSTS